MPLCCGAFYRDEKTQREGWERFKHRLATSKSHLGLALVEYKENDGSTHPCQGSYCCDYFVIFPLDSPDRTTFHEPDLMESIVLPTTPAELWNELVQHGKKGVAKFQTAANLGVGVQAAYA